MFQPGNCGSEQVMQMLQTVGTWQKEIHVQKQFRLLWEEGSWALDEMK